MTCYKLECSHWLKLQHSDWRANLVKDFFLNRFSTNESNRNYNIHTGEQILYRSLFWINFPLMRALKFITGHLIYNLAYTYKFQLKTTHIWQSNRNDLTGIFYLQLKKLLMKLDMFLELVMEKILVSWR